MHFGNSPEIVAKFNKIRSNVALVIKNVLHPHGNFTAIYVVVKVFPPLIIIQPLHTHRNYCDSWMRMIVLSKDYFLK